MEALRALNLKKKDLTAFTGKIAALTAFKRKNSGVYSAYRNRDSFNGIEMAK